MKSSNRGERKAEADQVRSLIDRIGLGDCETEIFGNLKASLEARGEQLADADPMLAATALAHDLTLVTDNLNYFRHVQGLRVESWIGR